MAKILLVEDHDTLGFALQAYLEMKGFEVLWSKDGDMRKSWWRVSGLF